MIPKNAYILTEIDDLGRKHTDYPKKKSITHDRWGTQHWQEDYILDFKDLMDYLEQNMNKNGKRVIVSKVVDVLEVKIESSYEEKYNEI